MHNQVYIETLGCSKNLVDSEQMRGILTKAGYQLVETSAQASIVIVNTCAFIHDAKVESIDLLLDEARTKRELLIMTGCLAQRYAEDLLDEMPEVDAFVGTTHFHEIVEIIETLREMGTRLVLTDDVDRILPEFLPRERTTPSHYAYVKISEGCDNRCTYCIIPMLRGRYRSRALEDIVTEVRELAAQGVKEIILIAQDSTRYGMDFDGECHLADLLSALDEVDGIRWIRVQYMYPDIIDAALLDTIAGLKKVVRYFDIPIQHSSDRILKRMNRHTTRARIVEVLDMILKRMPDAVIRTTLIVGFPGETEKDFEDLLSFIDQHRFHRLGAFTYSLEEETPAGRLPEQVDEETKTLRHRMLMERQLVISEEMMAGFVGRELEVIIDEPVEGEAVFVGRSAYDTPDVDGVVYVHTDRTLAIGEIYTVRITDHLEYDLIGEI